MFDKRTGYETVLVRSGEFVRGPKSERPEVITAIDAGHDDTMFIPAWNEVEDTLDVEEYDEGTHVATIHYDMDAKSYSVNYHVEVEDEEEAEEAEEETSADADA